LRIITDKIRLYLILSVFSCGKKSLNFRGFQTASKQNFTCRIEKQFFEIELKISKSICAAHQRFATGFSFKNALKIFMILSGQKSDVK